MNKEISFFSRGFNWTTCPLWIEFPSANKGLDGVAKGLTKTKLFLSKEGDIESDFTKVEYIKNAINEGTDSTWDFLVKSDNTVRNGKRSMDIAIINALRDDRKLHRFLGHDGAAICNAVADRFELFVGTNNSPGHYQEYLQDNDLSVKEKK